MIDYAATPRFRHLRLLNTDSVGQDRHSGSAHQRQTRSCVLLAGSDETRRQKLRQELSHTLEPGVMVVEASKAWEVVQQAPDSRLVMLTGDLHEASAESITRVLGRRYPGLPVLTLDRNSPVMTSRDDGAFAASELASHI